MKTETDEVTAIVYRCPLCESAIEIEEHLIGEIIDCPSCDRPFQAVPPRAHPVSSDERIDPSKIVKGDTVADDEAVERVIHPVVFRRHLFGTLVCSVLLIAGLAGLSIGLAGSAIEGISGPMLMIPCGVAAAIALVMLGKWFVESRMQSLLLTNERLIYRYGIIHRGTSEVRHDDVRNMKVDQNLYERLLGFGDIAVSSAGQDDMEVVINDIPSPGEVVDFIRKRQ